MYTCGQTLESKGKMKKKSLGFKLWVIKIFSSALYHIHKVRENQQSNSYCFLDIFKKLNVKINCSHFMYNSMSF